MSLFCNPLRLWRKEYGSDDELDPKKCHATATTRGHNSWSHHRHQCANAPKSKRPFAASGGNELPVCGVHARHYDNEMKLHQEREARSKKLDDLSDRCQVSRENGLPSACGSGTTQVLVNIDELETLLRRKT